MHNHQLTNSEILEELNKHVYGHDKVKRTLINAINKARVSYQTNMEYVDYKGKRSCNVLLMGESGTGKTYIIQTLSMICDFPLLVYDASKIQPNGSSSSNLKVDDVIADIEAACKDHLIANGIEETRATLEEAMSSLVIFIDEFDKLSEHYEGSGGNWNRQIQSHILTMFDNLRYDAGPTFIFAGAFEGLEDNSKKHKEARIGFTPGTANTTEADLEHMVCKYGILIELMGRIDVVVALDKFTSEQYREILLKTILPETRRSLKLYGINTFSLTNVQIKDIIKKTIDSKQGVRMLRKQVQQLTEELEFNYGKSGGDGVLKQQPEKQEEQECQ